MQRRCGVALSGVRTPRVGMPLAATCGRTPGGVLRTRRGWATESGSGDGKHEVVLYTKHDCPLCHKAKRVLQRVQAQAPFELKEIDILKSDEETLHRYCFDIPVVHLNGKEVFRHRVDEEKMLALVRQPSSNA